MLRNGFLGAVAGAAGNLALEAVGYGDMLLRGRSASSAPANVAGILAKELGIAALAIDTEGEQADNRRSAAGALLGYALGVGLGGLFGLLRPHLRPVPAPVAAVALGLAAMAASDLSIARSGVSDPKTWTATDWLSDLIPHLAYGLVTVVAFDAATVHSDDERDSGST
jgi:hypothetical protein